MVYFLKLEGCDDLYVPRKNKIFEKNNKSFYSVFQDRIALSTKLMFVYHIEQKYKHNTIFAELCKTLP